MKVYGYLFFSLLAVFFVGFVFKSCDSDPSKKIKAENVKATEERLDKSYDSPEIEFDFDTYDFGEVKDGEVVEEKPIPADLTENKLEENMKSFLGDQYQTPPMFSAKKIDGVPLYKMARKGKKLKSIIE